MKEFNRSLVISAERCQYWAPDSRPVKVYFVVWSLQVSTNCILLWGSAALKTPNSLVLHILSGKTIGGAAIEWGVQQESSAIKKYVGTQSSGHTGIAVFPSGFLISDSHLSLGASPNGLVYDPSSKQPYGSLEVPLNSSKCITWRSVFFCTLVTNSDGESALFIRIVFILHRFRAKWPLESVSGMTSSFSQWRG